MRRVLMVGHDPSTSLPTSAPGGTTSEPADASGGALALTDLFCPGCGYNLRGIDSDRCPECGLSIDREALARTAGSLIPWTHRHQIGRWRAYWRTVWMVLRHPAQVAAEVARPVSYRDAQKFRWICVIIAAIPLAAALAWGVATEHDQMLQDAMGPMAFGSPTSPLWVADLLLPWTMGVILPGILPIGSLLLFAAMSGTASYFLHPRRLDVVQQNRAIAVSGYIAARLVLIWIPFAFLGAHLALDAWKGLDQLNFSLVLFLGAFHIGAWALWLFLLLSAMAAFLRQAAHRTSATAWAIAPLQLPLWTIVGLLVFVVLPWIVGYVQLLIGSLGR